jgi:hypothetical protein
VRRRPRIVVKSMSYLTVGSFRSAGLPSALEPGPSGSALSPLDFPGTRSGMAALGRAMGGRRALPRGAKTTGSNWPRAQDLRASGRPSRGFPSTRTGQRLKILVPASPTGPASGPRGEPPAERTTQRRQILPGARERCRSSSARRSMS